MIVAFVHAKGNSERLPGKNLLPLGDMLLFLHAVRAAQAAESIDRVIVDSDSDEILYYAKQAGTECLKRPKRLATNKTSGDDLAYWQASNVPQSSAIVQVVPTSPFIRPDTIDRAVELFAFHCVDSVAGVRREKLYLWEDDTPAYRYNGRLPNSNDLPDVVWETTGLYVVRTDYAIARKQRINPKSCGIVELRPEEAVDINTLEDYEFAKIVWAGMEALKC